MDLLSAAAKAQLYAPFLRDYAYGWRVLETDHGCLIRHNDASSLGSSAICQRFIETAVSLVTIFPRRNLLN
jgi:hypothetical protein